MKDFATKDDLSKVEYKLEKLQDNVQDNKMAIAELGWRISSLERVQYAVLLAILTGLAKMFFFST